ncbi:hypothetical protein [Aliisedimentitalea sp. MJ-SS2]|uniref:hypothetical protein n=1 Tax=Aliisedimentitalea sp. MJ-SS2 TaxID=3049795 RepID=UPI00346007B8
MQQVKGEAEFLFLALVFETAPPGSGVLLENWTLVPFKNIETERWDAIYDGAKTALNEAGIQDAKVCVADVRIFDVASSPSLFRKIAETCIRKGLESPEIVFTESGQRRPLDRWKEANQELLLEWGNSS